MYESFYGFKEKPFSLLPDPAFLFFAKQHKNALTMLEYGLTNQAGFTVITGDIGCGKTTLIRHLLNHVEHGVTVGLLSNTQKAIGELLQWVLLAFRLPYQGKEKVELYNIFFDFIGEEYAKNRRTVLIIDEAQNLGPETLEELRMLSNINADKDQVLQLILVGQPELRDTLSCPDLAQFAQRIAVDYYIAALDASQTRAYVTHRLTVAGGAPDLFTAEACELIHIASGGVPRLINTLSDTALVYGFAEQISVIGADLAREVIQDKADSIVFSGRKKPDDRREIVSAVPFPSAKPAIEQNDVAARDMYRDIFSSLDVGT